MPSRARPATAPLTSGRPISWGPNASAPADEALDAPVGPLAPPDPVPGVSGLPWGFSSPWVELRCAPSPVSPDMLGLHLPGLAVLLRVLLRGGHQLERLALGAALGGQLGAHRSERLRLDLLVELEDRVDEHLRAR